MIYTNPAEPQHAAGDPLSKLLASLSREEPAHRHSAVASVAANEEEGEGIFDMLESFIKGSQHELSRHSVLPSVAPTTVRSVPASSSSGTSSSRKDKSGVVRVRQQQEYEEGEEYEFVEEEEQAHQELGSSYQPPKRHGNSPSPGSSGSSGSIRYSNGAKHTQQPELRYQKKKRSYKDTAAEEDDVFNDEDEQDEEEPEEDEGGDEEGGEENEEQDSPKKGAGYNKGGQVPQHVPGPACTAAAQVLRCSKLWELPAVRVTIPLSSLHLS